MGHPNEEIVRRGYDAFARGDMDTIGKLFADDIVFHVSGGNPMSGEYRGKDQVFGFLRNVMERSDGTFKLQAHDVVANDEHTVGLTIHTAQRDGKSASYHSIHVWHVRNGRLAEMWEYPEQPAFDAFWS